MEWNGMEWNGMEWNHVKHFKELARDALLSVIPSHGIYDTPELPFIPLYCEFFIVLKLIQLSIFEEIVLVPFNP